MIKENLLAELRNQKKLTMSQMGDLLGVSQVTYLRYEKAETDVSTETLSKLANIFEVSTDYLLGRTDIKEPASRKPPTLDDLLKKENLSEMEKRFILVYINLDAVHRKAFADALEEAAEKASCEKEPPKPDIVEYEGNTLPNMG